MNSNNENHHNNDEEEDRKLPALTPAALDYAASEPKTGEEEDDDWSRQVETDETATAAQLLHEDSFRLMESVVESSDLSQLEDHPLHHNHHASLIVHDDDEHHHHPVLGEHDDDGVVVPDDNAVVPPVPSHPQLTLKERLVLRERQRRIETERARLKRQFALSNHHHHQQQHHHDSSSNHQAGGESSVDGLRETGSAAEDVTLGEESTRAHADEEAADQEKLGFNMERFLRNSDSFNPQLEPTDEDHPTGFDQAAVGTGATSSASPGVLMERFLSEPVVVQPEPSVGDGPNSTGTIPSDDVQRAVSFDVDGRHSGMEEQEAHRESFAPSSCGDATNISGSVSVQIEDDDDEVTRDPLASALSMDAVESASDANSNATPQAISEEPRVLRLTEADMQEMAAIEEASIGNAPPSEREEEILSEIGELADFGPRYLDPSGNFSQGTATTAQESASLISGGNQSAPATSEHGQGGDHHSLDDMSLQPLFTPRMSLGPLGAANALETNPPSIIADDSTSHLRDEVIEQSSHDIEANVIQPRLVESQTLRLENVSNRNGLVNHLLQTQRTGSPLIPIESTAEPIVPSPLASEHGDDGSFRDLPDEPWSPAGKMQVSPIPPPVSLESLDAAAASAPETPAPPFLMVGGNSGLPQIRLDAPANRSSLVMPNENTPLLMDDVPPEIITRRRDLPQSTRSDGDDKEMGPRLGDRGRTISTRSDEAHNRGGSQGGDDPRLSLLQHCRQGSFYSAIDSVFSDIRSEEEFETEKIISESEHYLLSSVLAKAFPERMFALVVTLAFEVRKWCRIFTWDVCVTSYSGVCLSLRSQCCL